MTTHGSSWHQDREIRLAKRAKRLGRARARRPFRGMSKPAAMRLVEKYLGRMNPVLTNPKRKLTQAQKLARAKKQVGKLFAGGRHLGTGSSSKRWRRYLKWNKAAAKAGEWQSFMGHTSARRQRESARGMQYLDIDLGLKRAHAGQWNSKGRKPVRMSNPKRKLDGYGRAERKRAMAVRALNRARHASTPHTSKRNRRYDKWVRAAHGWAVPITSARTCRFLGRKVKKARAARKAHR